MKTFATIVLWAIFTAFSFSQEKAVVEILTSAEHPTGRATVFKVEQDVAYALTAYHVVYDNPAISFNGFKVRDRLGNVVSGAKVLRGQKDIDLAVIKFSAPENIVIAPVGEIGADAEADNLDISVYDIEWVLHKPRLSLVQNKFYYFDFSPAQGESGGPVFSEGKLIGVISGGWFWIEAPSVFDAIQRRKTWPLRAGKVKQFVEGN